MENVAAAQSSPAAPEIVVCVDAAEVARRAAERFIQIAHEAIASYNRFSVALAGGSTPKRLYELLASDEYRAQVDWTKTHIFFGDERCVPPDDAESNYRMAHEALLAHVPIPAENVHRMIGEGDPNEHARQYESELREFFKQNPTDESAPANTSWPRFDLILLGMGDDGHTASLFPYSKALREQWAWVVANPVEKLNTLRLTLTAPAINHAAHVAFLVTGASKSARLAEVIKGARDPERLPSQLIQPENGALVWLVDEAAAANL